MALPKFRSKKPDSLSFIQDKEINEWEIHEVGSWLESIGLGRYRDAFFFNEIDGEMLADIDEDDLIAIPIERLGHRKKILRRVALNRGDHTSISSTGSRANSASDHGSDVGSCASLSSTHANEIRVKGVYGEDARYFFLSLNETYESFTKKIQSEFGKNVAAKFKDEDGDLVVVRNQSDVAEAVRIAQQERIKFIIFSSRSKKKKSKSKKASSVSSKKSDSVSSETDFSVLENFVDAVIVSDRRGKIQFFNAAAEDMFGHDREDMIGQNVRLLMNDKDSAEHNSYLRRYRREGKSQIIGKGRKVLAKRSTGETFDVWLSLSESNTTFTAIVQEIRSESGGGLQTAVATKDLSSAFAAFEKYPDPVVVLDTDGFIQFANRSVSESFLHEPGSLLGQSCSLICPAVSSSSGTDLLGDFKKSLKGARSDTLLKNSKRDVICYTKKNTIIAKVAEFSHRVIENCNYFVVQFRTTDGSPGAASGTILQAQRQVIASLVIPALIIDQNAIVQEMNTAARDIFGYSLSETLGQNIQMLIPPGETRDNHTNYVAQFAATGKGRGPKGDSSVVGKGREVVGISKAGQKLRLNLSVTVASEQSGEKIFTGILQLITRLDEIVIASEVLNQQISVTEQLLIPSCVITGDSIVRGFNKGAQELFGLSEKEVIGQNVNVLIPHGEIRNMHSKIVERYALGKKQGESVVVGRGRKIVGRHKNGENLTVTLSVTERKDGKLTIFTGVFTQ